MSDTLKFERDSRKAATNRAKHKVFFEKAVTVFSDPFGRIADDPRHSESATCYSGNRTGGGSSRSCLPNGDRRFVLSARGRLRAASGENMRKNETKKRSGRRVADDEILPEYDFSRARPNKYASRYAKGAIVITLDPDVAAVFHGLNKRTKLCGPWPA